MSSRGNSFLRGYWLCVRRFIGGYLLICCAVLAGLLVVDAVFPQARVYGRIKQFLQAALSAGHAGVRP